MAKDTPIDEVISMYQNGSSEREVIRTLSEKGFSPVQISDAMNQAKIKKEISSPEGLSPSIMDNPPQQAEVPKPMSYVPKPMSMAPGMQGRPQGYPQEMPQEQQQPMEMPMTQEVTPEMPQTDYSTYPYQYPMTYEQQSQPSHKIDAEAMEEIAEEIISEKWLEIKNKISDVVEWKSYAEKRIESIDDRIKRMELSLDRLQSALLAKVQEYGRDIKDLGAEMAGLEGAFGKILTPFVDNMKELSRITGDLKKTVPQSSFKLDNQEFSPKKKRNFSKNN